MTKDKKFDQWLESTRNRSRQEKPGGGVWPAIQTELVKTRRPGILARFLDIRPVYRNLAIVAAALLITLPTTILLYEMFRGPQFVSSDEAYRLAEQIQSEVFDAQKAYEHSIKKMENLVSHKRYDGNSELAQLYFQKLQTLDMLILECKSYMDQNPYNPALHRQLFYAYQSKIETLQSLLTLSEGDKS